MSMRTRAGLWMVTTCCTLCALASPVSLEYVRNVGARAASDIVSWRRTLHSAPELMYQEFETSRLVQTQLGAMGVNFTAGWGVNTRPDRIVGAGGTGVVAEIGHGQPIVALRADMDALPIQEETAVPFKSKNHGRMHACGHDGHTAMLLGAAKVLTTISKESPSAIPASGTIRLIFQPAEEGGAGAKRMCEEGAIRDVKRVFGLHIWPTMPSGTLAGRPGLAMGAADNFDFRIHGRGGHGAMPHLSVDPVVAGTAVVQAAQAIISRNTDASDSAVISITKFHAGDAPNVIPAEAALGGTIRATSSEKLNALRARLMEVAETTARAYGCTVSNWTFMPDPFPPTINDANLWEWVVQEASTGPGAFPVVTVPPTMGAEDFAFYAEEVPGAFVFLGQGTGHTTAAPVSGDFPTNVSVHNPRFNMDENVLPLGSALLAHLALRSLESLSGPKHEQEL